MEKYLNFNFLLENFSKNELIEYGFVKLFLIRQFSIHYRHAIKNTNKLDYIDIQNKNLKKKIKKDFIYNIFYSKIRKLHKLPRNFYSFKERKIPIFIDFDNTLTSMVKIAIKYKINIKYFLLKIISSKIREYFKKDFYDFFINEEFLKYFKLIILTSKNEKEEENIIKYLEKHNINFISSIICIGSDKEKINYLIEKSSKRVIMFLIDDNIDILKIAKLYCVLPIYCKKGKLRKVIENDEYLF